MFLKNYPILSTIVIAIMITAAIAWPYSLSAAALMYVQQVYVLAIAVLLLVLAGLGVFHCVRERIREKTSCHPDDFNRTE